MQHALPVSPPADFQPLVDACRACGISRSVAFELAAAGKLETFAIGRRRYVKLDSLRTLPERLASEQGGNA
ncbi:MAG: hypothetical protein ACTHJG_02070 [Rhodanobacteraceae bacterium]